LQKKEFLAQLNLDTNLSLFLFKTQLETSEPVKDWHALTTSMLFVLNNFNNLEQPLTQFSRSHYSLPLNISSTVKDTAIVTMEDE